MLRSFTCTASLKAGWEWSSSGSLPSSSTWLGMGNHWGSIVDIMHLDRSLVQCATAVEVIGLGRCVYNLLLCPLCHEHHKGKPPLPLEPLVYTVSRDLSSQIPPRSPMTYLKTPSPISPGHSHTPTALPPFRSLSPSRRPHPSANALINATTTLLPLTKSPSPVPPGTCKNTTGLSPPRSLLQYCNSDV